jgi:hypothetical protein
MNLRLFSFVSLILVVFVAVVFSAGIVLPTKAAINANPAPTPVPDQARLAMAGFKGVTLGTQMNDARAVLGEPREKSNEQDYWVFPTGESVQIVYNEDHSVRTISTSYFGPKAAPPVAKDIFGADVEANAEGAINKMVKYPKAGYWISYIKTAGPDPMVMITVQKMEREES